MVEIHGYRLDETKWETKGGGGQCNIATKEGKKYFIKRLRPKYPVSNNYPANEKAKMIQRCDRWFENRKRVLKALPGTGTGNIVKPIEYFRDGSCYYEVAYYIEEANIPYDQVWKIDKEDRIFIMQTVASSLASIHDAGIIHGDLDPENILISKSSTGKLITKMIDFSDSFFESDPPRSIVSKEFWMSPEMVLYAKAQDRDPNPYKNLITCKTDVFSLGIIFHQYCSKNGEPPECSKGVYPWQEFGFGKKPRVDQRIEPELRTLIEKMLERDHENRYSMAEVKEYLQKLLRGSKPEHGQELKLTSKAIKEGIVKIERRLDYPKKVDVTYTDGRKQTRDLWLVDANGYVEK